MRRGRVRRAGRRRRPARPRCPAWLGTRSSGENLLQELVVALEVGDEVLPACRVRLQVVVLDVLLVLVGPDRGLHGLDPELPGLLVDPARGQDPTELGERDVDALLLRRLDVGELLVVAVALLGEGAQRLDLAGLKLADDLAG